MFEVKSIYDKRTTLRFPMIYSASAEESVKSNLRPEDFKLLKNHFSRFYDYLMEHIKKYNRHKLEKYRNAIEIYFFTEFSNYINQKTNDDEKVLSDNFLITQFINQRFFYANLIFSVLFGSTGHLEKLLTMDRQIYPPALFERADEIYKDNSKLTFQKALEEAIKLFPEFKDIDPKSLDFYNINDSYKKYRSKKSRSRRLIKK